MTWRFRITAFIAGSRLPRPHPSAQHLPGPSSSPHTHHHAGCCAEVSAAGDAGAGGVLGGPRRVPAMLSAHNAAIQQPWRPAAAPSPKHRTLAAAARPSRSPAGLSPAPPCALVSEGLGQPHKWAWERARICCAAPPAAAR